MAGSPKDNEEKLRRILNAWKSLAPDKTFADLTVAQFEAAIAPSFNTRAQIADLENQLTQLINSRNDADAASMEKVAQVVAGVQADPAFGPNSSLFEAMGYVRKSERRPGGRRGAATGGTPPTP